MAISINIGTPVRSSDDDRLGDIDQLVIDYKTKGVSHVIIDKNLRSGGKIVPFEYIESADNDGVRLTITKDQVEQLPQSFEKSVVEVRDASMYVGGGTSMSTGAASTGPMVAGSGGGGLPQTGSSSFMRAPIGGEVVMETYSSLPADCVVIDENTEVVANDFEKIGRVDVVNFGAGNQVESFVLKAGRIRRTDIEVPVDWIQGISSDHVRLNVTTSEFNEKIGQS